MQRGAEKHSLCDWHLLFALIYRARRLSARNPGPASPVETFHPREIVLYQIVLKFSCYTRGNDFPILGFQ
jgi:hypothetical protein